MRLLTLLLAIAIVCSGCGAIIFKSPQQIIVTSNATNAYIPGHGKLPGTIQLDRSRSHVLQVQAEGYAPGTLRIESSVSVLRVATSIILNGAHGIFTLFISTVLGCMVDAGAGAWQVLEPDETYVELQRSGFEAPAVPGGNTQPADPIPTASTAPARTSSSVCDYCGLKSEGGTFCANCGSRKP